MSRREIEELLKLKGWNQVQLAEALEISEATVSRWLEGLRRPLGPARVLMRHWLTEAQNDSKKQPA